MNHETMKQQDFMKRVSELLETEGYGLVYDSETERNVLVMKVPLKLAADHPDVLQAMIMLRGFFEQMKAEALQVVGIHKMKRKQNGILQPGVDVPRPSVPLKVH